MKILLKCHSGDAWPVFISGNHPTLGNWDPDRAQVMRLQDETADGRAWSSTIDLAPGETIEFKFLKRTDHGIWWENGMNRTYTAIPGLGTIFDSFRV